MRKMGLLLGLIWLAHPGFSQVRVVDGDTLELNGITYRLNGIDAPEFGQSCQNPSGSWACGSEALKRLVELTNGAKVQCEVITRDPYDRIIATCSANGRDLGELLTQEGLAWAFVKFSDDYVDAQAKAQKKKIGIWSGNNQPAWTYREVRWTKAQSTAPQGCPIKGNISRNGRIYHPPWSPWYSRTRINLSKGERWFCDEAEAIKAGWRAPRWP